MLCGGGMTARRDGYRQWSGERSASGCSGRFIGSKQKQSVACGMPMGRCLPNDYGAIVIEQHSSVISGSRIFNAFLRIYSCSRSPDRLISPRFSRFRFQKLYTSTSPDSPGKYVVFFTHHRKEGSSLFSSVSIVLESWS
ncbi:expressed unknown protein [Ectocarpus siliculosus]|uniref:Uncharacterized protein n=1 Tax=Ectocarpus siliculosus TaxID=2880 RepID=D8LS11_ECTSI|nr:expressed unknown protein [Ectocarpus siliculosus]|eukprot:CBN73795.1 expressed unknown protein [Ectocarpus siliculosus]